MTTPEQRSSDRVAKATNTIRRTFYAILAVTIVALSIVGCQEQRNRQLVRDNRTALRVIAADQKAFEHFRIERSKDVNQTAILICRKQNASNQVLADLIRRLLTVRPSTPPTASRLRSVEILEQALGRLKPQNCLRLPTAPGANPKGTG